MATGQKIVVLDPVQEADVEPGGIAARLDSLRGKTVGLYSNEKLNATKLLDMVEAILHERYQIKGVVRGKYQVGRVMRKEEWGAVERCDTVILGLGD